MQPDEAKPPLRFRKLRIAWSVFWGLACVLLIVLWVRSYWAESFLGGPIGPHGFYLMSMKGRLVFNAVKDVANVTNWDFDDFKPNSIAGVEPIRQPLFSFQRFVPD